MATIAPSQKMGGLSDARDWPQLKAAENTLYLLSVAQSPTMSGTPGNPGWRYTLQWNWITIGTDIRPGQVASNRGDKSQTNTSIQDMLGKAHYPHFAQVCTFVADPVNIGQLISTPDISQGQIRWTRPDFRGSNDFRKSGALYGVGSVNLYFESDIPNSIA